jgi:Uma2 family endonuclease
MALAFDRNGRHFTYTDYLKWDGDERWELIDGTPYSMTPAPGAAHQRILMELSRQFANYFHERPCEVFPAPFDVRLPGGTSSDQDIETVVQPDISVICDPRKIDERGGHGAPDLVVEILSPSTSQKDLKIKLPLYENASVKECCIAYPVEKIVMIFALQQNGRYGRPSIYGEKDIITTNLFDGLAIDLEPVFRDPVS